jgi:hypothetical protein
MTSIPSQDCVASPRSARVTGSLQKVSLPLVSSPTMVPISLNLKNAAVTAAAENVLREINKET